MLRPARVVMDEFMQGRKGRHRIQQQDKTHQHRGEDRLAGQVEMTL